MMDIKRYYTEEDMIKLDMELDLIPMTFDGIFKGIFKKRLDLLKIFILSQIGISVKPDECNIELLDSELPKDNKNEYQKTVDIYVRVDDLYVNIEVNREYFRDVEKRNLIFADKLHAMILERGESAKDIDNKIFIQINLNAVDKYDENREKLKYGSDTVIMYGIRSGRVYNNKYVLVKFLEYYRDLYYNKGEKLDDDELWLVLFTSRTFQELYNVSKEIFDKEMQYEFIRKVIEMNRDQHIFSSWELEKLNEMVEINKRNNAVKEGLKQGLEEGYDHGIEQGIEQGTYQTKKEHIKNMLEENLDISLISKITNLSEEEIFKIRDSIDK